MTETEDAVIAPRTFSTLAAMRAVFASTRLTATERLVALAIVNHAKVQDGTAYPGRGCLARETQLSVRTVSRALTVLREAGIVRWVKRQTKKGDPDTNLYTVTLPGAWKGPVTKTVPHATETGGVRTARPEGQATVAHKQLTKQDQKESVRARAEKREGSAAHATESDVARTKSEAALWTVVVQIHRELRVKHYHSAGVSDRVKAHDKKEIVDLFVTIASRALGTWRTIHASTWGAQESFAYVVEDVLRKWFVDYQTPYLIEKRHGLFALLGDLTALEAAWDASWNEVLAKERAKR